MAVLKCNIPPSLLAALEARAADQNSGISHLVTAALAQYLAAPVHTLFQVSTSGALVAGLYDGVVTCQTILAHGDFGLGTFENLDGEMVVLDGKVYRARADGTNHEALADDAVPFAVVTRFAPEIDLTLPATPSFAALTAICDSHRNSDNIFYAFRLDGHFRQVRTRAVAPPADQGGLVDAARAQSEFTFTDLEGTLVGLWSPGFAGAVGIPGYHLHFLSADRQHGGHLLDCAADGLRLRVEALADVHIALPETASFLRADLSRDSAADLAYAERSH